MEKTDAQIPVRLLIAARGRILRSCVQLALEARLGGRVVIVGSTGDSAEADRLLEDLVPDVVIVGEHLAGGAGVEFIKGAAERARAETFVLLMTGGFSAAADALKRCTVLTAESGVDELLAAIAPGVDSRTKGSGPDSASAVGAVASVLSPREREVLRLVADGMTTREIAAALFISARTVETHRRNIGTKLAINSVAGLTKYAIRAGISRL